MLTRKISAAVACFAISAVGGCAVPGEYGYGGDYGHTPAYTPPSSGVVQGATPGDPLFSTNTNEYEPNRYVTVSLNNATRSVMTYNLCHSVIEHWDGDWRSVGGVSPTCSNELRSLGPGQSTTFSFQFPGFLPHGRYRIRTNVGGRRAVVTNTFVVRSGRGD